MSENVRRERRGRSRARDRDREIAILRRQIGERKFVRANFRALRVQILAEFQRVLQRSEIHHTLKEGP